MSALLIRTPSLDYSDAWQTQRRLADARRRDAIPDVCWLLEHPPTYTYGRHATRDDLFDDDESLARCGASCHAVDRGGQMTWHGPGQTTGYVIWNLRPGNRVRDFVCALALAMADATELDQLATDDGKGPGLYRRGRKLGSVGIRVEGGVTTHGLALNRDVDLSWFGRMTACGAPEVAATSIRVEGGDPDRVRLEARLADALARRLGRPFEEVTIETLLEDLSSVS